MGAHVREVDVRIRDEPIELVHDDGLRQDGQVLERASRIGAVELA